MLIALSTPTQSTAHHTSDCTTDQHSLATRPSMHASCGATRTMETSVTPPHTSLSTLSHFYHTCTYITLSSHIYKQANCGAMRTMALSRTS